jgi:hypothetical protein
MGQFTQRRPLCAILAVRERHAVVSQLQEDLLDHVLKLLDVYEKRPFFPDPELNFGPHLPSNRLIGLNRGAGSSNGTLDLVSKPRDDVGFVLERLRRVPPDDPGEFIRVWSKDGRGWFRLQREGRGHAKQKGRLKKKRFLK